MQYTQAVPRVRDVMWKEGKLILRPVQTFRCGPGSVVGITTGYGLDGPRIDSRWDEIFRTCLERPWGPPSLLYNGYRVFPGVKSGRGVTLTPHPLLVPWSRTSRAIPLLPVWTYGLYRASVPVQGCTLPFLPFTDIWLPEPENKSKRN